MLRSIDISRYRGIFSGHIEGLGLINLLVGPNGSGKSTFLEAIYLPTQVVSGNPEAVKEGGFHVALRHNETGFPSENAWFAKTQEAPIVVGYGLDDGPRALKITARGGGSVEPAWIALPLFFLHMKLLDIPSLLDHRMEQRMWDVLLNGRGDRDLVRFMNEVYGGGIESFTYSAASQRLKVLFSERDYALNVDDLGAGMRVLLRLYMAALLSAGSALLVEEFDAYQHIGALRKLAQGLIRLAVQYRTQLFLTTHSTETVRAFVAGAGEVPGAEFRLFQTSLSPKGTFQASSVTAGDAETLLDAGFDLRSAL